MKIPFIVLSILILISFSGNSQDIRYEHNNSAVQKVVVSQFATILEDTIKQPVIIQKIPKGKPTLPEPEKLPIPPSEKIKLENKSLIQPPVTATNQSPAPTASFQALGDNNAQVPPDTHGAASANYLMTTLNTEILIQNKMGNVVSTQSLSSFWSNFSFSTIFDPRIHYDSYSNRWIFVVCIDKNSANSAILVAVSSTSNPTGTWTQWKIDADANNLNWVDYPTVGFNNRWIVISTNMFSNSTNSWAGPQILVLDKLNYYASGAGNYSSLYPGTGIGNTLAPAVMYDNSLSNMFLIQNYNGNSGGLGYLGLSKITGPTNTPSLSLQYSYPSTSSTWNWSPGSADFAPQLGSIQKIQNNDAKMQNVVYRNGSLWCTHHVFLPATSPTHTAVQWWEIDTVGNISQRARIEDGTGANYYAFPSMAVNVNSDVLIGYSSFSASQYASSEYAYRSVNDALNTMQTPVQYKSGLASYYKTQSGTTNRWGDYSATVVDPVNDIDFWTIQEYASQPISNIDRWGTFWANVQCPVPAAPTQVTWASPHCEGATIAYTASNVASATSYTWIIQNSPPGWSGGTSSTNTANFTAGYFPAYIDVTANNSCGSSTAYGFWSNPVPLPLSTFTAFPLTTTIGAPITITADETNSGVSYSWNFDSGNAVPGVGLGPHSVNWSTSGQKNVSLMTSWNGCSALQTTQTITVNPWVGLSEEQGFRIQVFPNPFSESLRIVYSEELSSLTLYDLMGKELLYKEQLISPVDIDTRLLAKGSYLLELKGNGIATIVRIMKE